MKKLKNKGYTYTINLANAEDDGSFACPKCNTSISPEDETENNYEIIDTKIVNNELTELVLTCNKCGCTIKLIGFHQDSNA